MLRRSTVLAFTAAALLHGCAQSSDNDTKETVDNLIEAGFRADDIAIVDGLVVTGRDAVVSLTASREMLQPDRAAGGKEQYRTNNVIGTGVQVICIDGSSLQNKYSTSLDNAIANYNGLGLRFSLQRVGSTAPPGCNAAIKIRVVSGSDCTGPCPAGEVYGSSGFPTNGLPYPEILLNQLLDIKDVGFITHVIMHEIAHTIGFRHSDYFNTSISCGSGGNEGPAETGVNWIPGSLTLSFVGGSILNACPRSQEPGQFTSTDIFAMEALYGNGQFEVFGCCMNEAPAVSSWGPGRLDLFVRGYDYALWHISIDNGVVGQWESLGGYLIYAPAAVSWGVGRIDVFAVSGDNGLWHNAMSDGVFSGWESLGGNLIGGPGASSWGFGRLDIFAQGAAGDLQHLSFDDWAWSSWESLGGASLGSYNPAAVSWGPGRIDIFTGAYGQNLQHLWFDDNNWAPWESFPGLVYSGPAASSWGPGRLDVFALDPYNVVKRMTFDSTNWSGWADQGYSGFSSPAAVSWGYGRVDVFTMGMSNDIWHKWFQ